MIKAAKPGIMPEEYTLEKKLSSSTLIFKNYENLPQILMKLKNERGMINELKAKALENSKKYTPLSIYNDLEYN